MSANQDESKLRRLWGPSELGEIDAAKLSFVATKTNGGAICWLEVLMRRARLLLSVQADSSIQGEDYLQQPGNVDHSSIEDILKVSIDAMQRK